jgi:hypothetical protein
MSRTESQYLEATIDLSFASKKWLRTVMVRRKGKSCFIRQHLENRELIINEKGEPSLKRLQAKATPQGLAQLEEALREKIPERHLTSRAGAHRSRHRLYAPLWPPLRQ